MVVVDQKVRFNAFEFVRSDMDTQSIIVTGTVYSVNYAHRVFHVVYYIDGIAQRTSFNFCDIGKSVRVV